MSEERGTVWHSRLRWTAVALAVYVLSFAIVMQFQPAGQADCLTLMLYAPLWYLLQVLGGTTA